MSQDELQDVKDERSAAVWKAEKLERQLQMLIAELDQVKAERDAALKLVDDTLAAVGAKDHEAWCNGGYPDEACTCGATV